MSSFGGDTVDYTAGMLQPAVDGRDIVAAIPGSNGASVEESYAAYKAKYQRSLAEPDAFWKETANDLVSWFSPFEDECVGGGNLVDGNMHWFRNGKLNVSHNCVDRHVSAGRGEQTALLWEGDEPGLTRNVTYNELQQGVCRVANVMKRQGVRKGEYTYLSIYLSIYLSTFPSMCICGLACVDLHVCLFV